MLWRTCTVCEHLVPTHDLSQALTAVLPAKLSWVQLNRLNNSNISRVKNYLWKSKETVKFRQDNMSILHFSSGVLDSMSIWFIRDLWLVKGGQLTAPLPTNLYNLINGISGNFGGVQYYQKKKKKNIVRLHMCGIYQLLYLVNSELCSHVSGWNWCTRCQQIFLIKIYWYCTEKFLRSYSSQWNDVEPEAHGAPGIKIGIWLWHRIQWQNFHGLS